MTFEKKPYGHLYPILADFDEDSDAQLEQVKQLSLITAAQDDERRRSKLAQDVCNSVITNVSQGIHGSSSLPELLRDSEKKPIGQSFDTAVPDLGDESASSQFVRPRPQASIPYPQRFVTAQSASTSSARVTTVPPPLPAVGPNASQNRSATFTIGAPSQCIRPEIPPRPVQYSARSHSVSPPVGKSTGLRNQISTPDRVTAVGGKDSDAPLINLSPPCRDFDLNDLDPLWQPVTRIPVNPPILTSQLPAAYTKVNPTSLASVLPQQTANTAYMKAYSSSLASSPAQFKSNITYNVKSNPLPSMSVLPQPTTSIRSIPVTSRASPHMGLTESQMYGMMWPVAPNYGWNWSSGMPICTAPKAEVTQPFQSGFIARTVDSPAVSLARSPMFGQDD